MPKILRDRGKSPYSRSNLKAAERLSQLRRGSYQRALTPSPLVDNSPTQFNPRDPRESSQFFPFVKLLKQLNYDFEITTDPQTKGNCFFMQDKYMKKFYEDYPEFVCFHMLCQVPQVDYAVVLFISLDTNGHCEIVSIGFIKPESTEGLSWFVEMFKKHNKSWDKIQFISCANKSEEREILVRAFPGRHLFLSFFDSLKTFKQDALSVVPMLNDTDVSKALQIFEQMFFISSESGFADLTKQLKQLSPHFFHLFKKNWLSKKECWAIGLQVDSKLLLKSINRYILKLRKLRNLLNCESAPTLLIEKLHGIIFKQRREYFQQFTDMFPPSLSPQNARMHALKKYSNQLTPYATELIIEQTTKAESMQNVQKLEQAKFKIPGSQLVTSFNACSCIFNTLLKLPCCHIFAVRNGLSLPLFDNALVGASWFSMKYQTTFLDLHSAYILNENKKVNFEQVDKFNTLVNLSRELWHLSLHCSEEVSQKRLDLFRTVVKAWKSNFKINILTIPKPGPSDNLVNVFENESPDYFRELYGVSLNDLLDSENEFSSFSLPSENENELL